jgi:succinoglycan biosynthesis transport protein ExoP
VSQLAVLQQQLANLTPPDNLRVGQVVAPAELPLSPARPNFVQNGLLAVAAGLVAGIGVAFARERLDDRLRGRRDLEAHARAPVLAVVPRVKQWRRRKKALLVTLAKPESSPAEAYRTLRTGLLFAATRLDAKVIATASPHPGEGKTVTTANLGAALAHAGKRVVVVSADLRKPRLHRFFEADNSVGLADVIEGRAPLEDVFQEPFPNLALIASGPTPRNPGELLSSEHMAKTLATLKERADLVLVDVPPVLAVADTVTLASLVDAVVLLADAEHTTRGAIDLARRQLKQVHATIIGSVLNNFHPSKATEYYESYDGYYSYRTKDPKALDTEDQLTSVN